MIKNPFTNPIIYSNPITFIDNEFYEQILHMDYGKPQSKERKHFHHTMISYLIFKTPIVRGMVSNFATHHVHSKSKLKILKKFTNPSHLGNNFYDCFGQKYVTSKKNTLHLTRLYEEDELVKIMNDTNVYVPLLKKEILDKLTFENGSFESLPFKQHPNLSYCLWIYFIDLMWANVDREGYKKPIIRIFTGQSESSFQDLNHQKTLKLTLRQIMADNINDYLHEYDPSELEHIYKKLENATQRWILEMKALDLIQ